MPITRNLLASAALLLIIGSAVAKTTYMQGYLTGMEYKKLSYNERAAYAMGFANGLLVTPFITRESGSVVWANNCLRNLSNVQLVAIIDKYLEDSPERWHESMNKLSFLAIRGACDRLSRS